GAMVWNTGYIDTQWHDFAQREAISFAIQATAKDWIKGAYYSLNNDRFIVTDAALLQDSLTQSLSTIGNRQDAVFAAVTLDRLRSDGCDWLATTLIPALSSLPYVHFYQAAIDGHFAYRLAACTISAANAQDWTVAGSEGNDALYGNEGSGGRWRRRRVANDEACSWRNAA
ncbi:MAG: hypothetical protein PHF20_07970, partial [Halothiobacillaceae bacterium]|nr:hypothetical protein [Halothiobacillaceae bacterium]